MTQSPTEITLIAVYAENGCQCCIFDEICPVQDHPETECISYKRSDSRSIIWQLKPTEDKNNVK